MSVRWILKSLTLIIVVAVPLLYYIPLLKGYPPFYPFNEDIRALEPGKVLNKLKSSVKKTVPTGDNDKVRVYKWQDSEGNWHFSNTPPSEGQSYSEELIDPDTNLIQGITTETDEQGNNTETTPTQGEAEPALLPQGVEGLMGKAKDAADAMNQRQKELEQVVGEP